ncbi:hypothetical protein EMCG_08421 [[Emmonsia] crescens]|uniref:Uncharacterized protein n=1 Tax=[Emmonsia] crescens TaxID=73230 RepID=A0A0G2I577_9EURO|nr:hypothetical protein EMCG_08421 [Emmonsia crescens UAMH 3008]
MYDVSVLNDNIGDSSHIGVRHPKNLENNSSEDDHYHLLGPWTRVNVLCHLVYGAANVFCLCYPKLLASDAGHRAGVLSLVNMIFLFAGVHLSLVADLLGVSLRRCRGSHRAAGWMVAGLAAVHALATVNKAAFTLGDSRNLFGDNRCRLTQGTVTAFLSVFPPDRI